MIVEWLLGLGQSVATWFLGLFGTAPAPSWLTDFGGLLYDMLSNVSGLGVWIPWLFISIAGGTVLTVWLLGLALRAARWILGLIPTMGGGS